MDPHRSRLPPKTLNDDDDDELAMADRSFSSRGCCCFFIPSSWERIRSPTPSSSTRPAPGLWRSGVKTLMKLREWSELVAGPKWKTFIRRFNRKPKPSPSSYSTPRHRRVGSFGYDPLSYALNFDGSPDRDVGYYPDFSTRFAAPPASAKSSMDLGGRDAPPLFAQPAAIAG